MYKEINFTENSKELLDQLQKGAFLTVKAGEVVKSPIIDECDLHIECKIVYKQPQQFLK